MAFFGEISRMAGSLVIYNERIEADSGDKMFLETFRGP